MWCVAQVNVIPLWCVSHLWSFCVIHVPHVIPSNVIKLWSCEISRRSGRHDVTQQHCVAWIQCFRWLANSDSVIIWQVIICSFLSNITMQFHTGSYPLNSQTAFPLCYCLCDVFSFYRCLLRLLSSYASLVIILDSIVALTANYCSNDGSFQWRFSTISSWHTMWCCPSLAVITSLIVTFTGYF